MTGYSLEVGRSLVEAWNRHHPPGTPVVLVNDIGQQIDTVTRSVAWCLGHGEPVVKVECIPGAYLLSRLVPIGAAETKP